MEATVVRTIYTDARTGFTVLAMRNEGRPFTAVCHLPEPPRTGQVLSIDGRWVDSKYGKQFEITTLGQTTDEISIEAFLASGAIKGVGPATAKRIVEHFGAKTSAVLDSEPGRLAEIPGISGDKARQIGERWGEASATTSSLPALCRLGLTLTMAAKAHARFGPTAASLVREDPYRLTKLRGVGFLRADEIAKKLGITGDHPGRIEAGVRHLVDESAGRGHCYLPPKVVAESGEKLLGVDESKVAQAAERLRKSGDLVGGEGRLYLPSIFEAEYKVERKLRDLSISAPRAAPGDREAEARVRAGSPHLTPDQVLGVVRAVQNRLSVVTGLPGTGKTTILRALVDELNRRRQSYALCAPTGKAAKRISESTGTEAKTIHRLLEFSPEDGFRVNRGNPLGVDCLVVDESSMVDVLLMANLLDAVDSTRTSVVLVGDSDQLPSVGPGNVLRDIIAGTVCHVTRLTQIHRQAEQSGIVLLAHMVNAGQKPSMEAMALRRDIRWIEADDPEEARDAVLRVIREVPFAEQEIQTLSPMRRGGLGVEELNRGIRGVWRGKATAAGEEFGGFRRDDRVIHLINNYNKDVFNGEVGVVSKVDGENGAVNVDYGDKIVPYDAGDLDQLGLAYALTIHKAQGSEFPCVVMPLHTQHYIMLKRQVLYTGLTRAKRMLVLVGSEKALATAVRNNEEQKRYTGLFRS